MEEVVHVASTHLGSLLMTVVRVLREGLNGEYTKEKEEGGRTGCRGRVLEVGWGVVVEVEMGRLTTGAGGLPM